MRRVLLSLLVEHPPGAKDWPDALIVYLDRDDVDELLSWMDVVAELRATRPPRARSAGATEDGVEAIRIADSRPVLFEGLFEVAHDAGGEWSRLVRLIAARMEPSGSCVLPASAPVAVPPHASWPHAACRLVVARDRLWWEAGAPASLLTTPPFTRDQLGRVRSVLHAP